MNMINRTQGTALLSLIFLFSCSTEPTLKAVRNPASLDNDATTKIDPALESQNDPDEEKHFNDVAQLVAGFVSSQARLRERHATDTNASAQAIEHDLPAPGYATRDVHRKTHGCFNASLDIDKGIESTLNAQIAKFVAERGGSGSGSIPEPLDSVEQLGVFQPGAHYDAIVRYSNGNPGYRHDREPDARGMAMKILPRGSLTAGVPTLDAQTLNKATLLDVLAINFPVFFVNDPGKYFAVNQLFLKGADDFKNALLAQAEEDGSVFLKGMNALERKLALLTNGSIIDSPLFQKYWSMVPSRLGNAGQARAVKYAFFPKACDGASAQFAEDAKTQWAPWTERHDYLFPTHTLWEEAITPPFEDKFAHDYLRQNLSSRLAEGDFCFGLMFQLYRDQDSTNIEDATDIWLSDSSDRDQWKKTLGNDQGLGADYWTRIDGKSFSPYIEVATLRIARTPASYPVGNTKTCEDLSFNPWNGKIGRHKPLGVVSRMKRRVYDASRRTRQTLNGIPTLQQER